MNETDHLRQTLEYYRQQRRKHLEELEPIETMIRQLERDLGEQSTLDQIHVPDTDTVANSNVARILRSTVAIRPDEFYGMSQSDAAKMYLRKIGYAIPFDDLVSALQKGGATLGGADPKKTLYVSLARNPRKEFVWPSKDHIGLKEFYDRKG